jgi:hypothetical protein
MPSSEKYMFRSLRFNQELKGQTISVNWDPRKTAKVERSRKHKQKNKF